MKGKDIRDDQWFAIFQAAVERGDQAARAARPAAMHVNHGTTSEAVAEGLCGSARVLVAAGGSGFSRWLIRSGNGRSAGRAGAFIDHFKPTQSLARANAFAIATIAHLAQHNIRAEAICSVWD